MHQTHVGDSWNVTFRGLAILAFVWMMLPAAARLEAAEHPNVLFIAVDDLRPDLGCYGHEFVKSPHIDRLAADGTVFNRAYCQQAVCSPSRTSLLTGRRPDTTKIYDLFTHFRIHLPDIVTLPQHFKQHGYHTQSIGKIYHGHLDDPMSWSAPSIRAQGMWYCDPAIVADLMERRKKLRDPRRVELEKDPATGTVLRVQRKGQHINGPSSEAANINESELPDGRTTDVAIDLLGEYGKKSDTPFFLAVGYLKPHLPFVAPRKYYDLYDLETVGLPDNPYPPRDCPPLALSDWGELRSYSDIPSKPATDPLSAEKTLQLRRAYYACVSYIDAQVGRLLDALDRLGLADNTIVILWGDHGWQLGEHGQWCKHTNFELATRVPLIVRAPGQRHPGARSNALVEFVDIYPTLCELAGLPLPDGLEGVSMVPVMKEPARAWKSAAFSQYPRDQVMGYSMRTDRFRYTEWRQGDEVVARELYDHKYDPAENVNVVDRPQHRDQVEMLSKQLKAGWQAARPGS